MSQTDFEQRGHAYLMQNQTKNQLIYCNRTSST